ncbi:kinetochore-associated protein 1-like [Plakobranchus ocellatus]|uniref:Kinetochore-associated protein 1-like n=1 Tax=Plakobranchus ocellatus TaxID=259542 RepID=A0AAV4A7L9_9GAST|nr:kinetochore-associated protein 1-like [Plakobranchus ocellatus]
MIKVHTLPEASVFITMDTTGQLYVWDCLTLTVVHTWQFPSARDFRPVLDQEGLTSLDKLQLLLLEKDKIKLINPMSKVTKVTYESPGGKANLTRCAVLQDDILITDCQVTEDLLDVETSVSLKLYAETSPEERLRKLLSRHRFEEAENLAQLYGLRYELDPSIIQTLMNKDKKTLEETYAHLESLKQKLHGNKSGDQRVQLVMEELEDAQFRLRLYKQVFGGHNFSAEEWGLFRFEKPLKLLSFIVQAKGFLIWKSDQDDIKQILRLVCGTDPKAGASIVEWVNLQVDAMESEGQSGWTEDAISTITSLLCSLEAICLCEVEELQILGEQVIKTKLTNMESLKSLRSLVQLLKNLKELSTKFNFSLPLRKLKQENEESLAFCMLSQVSTADSLPAALRSTILPYIRTHKLVADEIFAKYVEHLIQQQDIESGSGIKCGEMLKAIIDNIASPKEKVTAAVNLVKHIALPLPDFVSSLVEEILSSVDPCLCKSLKEQWVLKEASNIMWKNGIEPAVVISSLHVMQVAQCVLARGQGLKEAQKVLAAYNESHRELELYKFDCRLKVEHDQLDELIELINSLPRKYAMKCCQFVMTIAKNFDVEGLSSKLSEAVQHTQMLYYRAAQRLSSIQLSLTDDYFEQQAVKDQLNCINQMKNLQTRFGLALSVATLENNAKCRSLFAEHCGQYQGCQLLRQVSQIFTGVNMTASDVHHTSEILKQPLCDQMQMLDLCERVTAVLVTHSEPDHLMKAIELSELIRLAKDALRLEQAQVQTQAHTVSELDATDWDPSLFVETGSLQTLSATTPGKVLMNVTELGSSILEDSSAKWTEETDLQAMMALEDLAKQGQNFLALRVFYFLRYALANRPRMFSKGLISIPKTVRNTGISLKGMEPCSSWCEKFGF